MQYLCISNQSIYDITTELTGNNNLVGDVANLNNLPFDTVFAGGEIITLPASITVDTDILTRLRAELLDGKRVATCQLPDWYINAGRQGIDYDIIEDTLLIY